MNEQELRAIVREAIHRHAVDSAAASRQPATPMQATCEAMRQHASHALFAVPAGADIGGPCVIEPAVACNHCGYCRSYGH